MQELDEHVLASMPLMLAMALVFGGAFALAFGLIALIMEGLFALGEQALMAGLAAFGGFLFMALLARTSMRDQAEDKDSSDNHTGSSTPAW
jgi:membrane protein implicated in regulation of membrane protease activity